MAGWGVPTVSKSPMVVRKSTLAHECSVERVDADEIVQLLVAECNKKANIRGVGSSSRSVSPCIETCGICTVASDDLWGLCNCRHLFCANCWRSYLTDRIEMEAITLPCPVSDEEKVDFS